MDFLTKCVLAASCGTAVGLLLSPHDVPNNMNAGAGLHHRNPYAAVMKNHGMQPVRPSAFSTNDVLEPIQPRHSDHSGMPRWFDRHTS